MILTDEFSVDLGSYWRCGKAGRPLFVISSLGIPLKNTLG
jgi:hypothetical protein